MATIETIHTHGYQHFDNLQLSAQEFYKSLVTMIKSYEYPGVMCCMEERRESGWLSAKRQYLAVIWKRHKYLVCASPFGKSFFISWWHQEGANTGAGFASRFGRLGRALASHLEDKTLFEIDNELMFVSCVSTIIEAAVEKVKSQHGYTQDIKPTVAS